MFIVSTVSDPYSTVSISSVIKTFHVQVEIPDPWYENILPHVSIMRSQQSPPRRCEQKNEEGNREKGVRGWQLHASYVQDEEVSPSDVSVSPVTRAPCHARCDDTSRDVTSWRYNVTISPANLYNARKYTIQQNTTFIHVQKVSKKQTPSNRKCLR